ncbi:hypothetical protein J4050_00600 [Winogradskyella sp. DF17]|uniref:Oligosaccharide repeat unit polymerase n=1 Tax=Winogradskyella pelagia TaxID=2819984 RepID=A0ABS3SYU1_9FLAO|nr:hypothetical protein [Winogradskyella sp. DF17]MBO3115224.1 hypothetical protein [Winogradskyella sp. DF17]
MALVKPINLLLISFVIWLLAFLTIPATYINLGDSVWFAVFTLVVFNILFVLGLKSIKSVKVRPQYISNQKKQLLVVLLFAVGVSGVLVRIYQRLIIQGIYFADNLVKTRMELLAQEGGSGLLGVFSAVTYPFATIALMLAILWYKNMNKAFFVLVALFGLFPIADSILTESRLLIVFVGVMLLITFLASGISFFKSHTSIKIYSHHLFKLPSILLKKKVWIPTVVLLIGFIIFSQKVVNNRLAAFNYYDTIRIWEFYHDSKMDSDFKYNVRNSKNTLEKNKLMSAYSLKHYFAHSVAEYIRLISHLDKSWGYYYGMFEFYTYFKFLKIIGINIPSFADLNEVSYKPAVYTTFWGPFFIDFGVFGFVFSFLLGRFTQRTYLKAKQGSEVNILVYAFLGVVVLASFFVNFAMGGNLYFLTAIILTVILIRYWPNKLVVRKDEI